MGRLCDATMSVGKLRAIRNVKKSSTPPWIVSTIGVLLLCLFAVQGSGCGGATAPSKSGAESSNPGQTTATAKGVNERYDLARDEQRGGHTLSRHGARTDAELAERLERERNISAGSRWTDRETAEQTGTGRPRPRAVAVEEWTRP